MKIAFHPHLGTLVESNQDIEKLLSLANDVSLCLDTAHLKSAGSDPIEAIEKFAANTSIIHLKDYSRGSKQFTELGKGDDMIREMGATLKQGLRPNDYIARWRTGDEFIVVLPDTPLKEEASVGKRLTEMLKEKSSGWELPITISIGVVSYPKNGNTVNELIDAAEKALRIAKEQGKDRVAIIG